MKFNVKPPMRLAMGKLMLDGKARTANDVLNLLAPHYGDEGQLNLGNIENHLQALRAVGILTATSGNCAQNDEDDTLYAISIDGERRVRKYL